MNRDINKNVNKNANENVNILSSIIGCMSKGKVKFVLCVVLCALAFVFCFDSFEYRGDSVQAQTEECISGCSTLPSRTRASDIEAAASVSDVAEYSDYYNTPFIVFLSIVVSASLGMMILNFKKDGSEK